MPVPLVSNIRFHDYQFEVPTAAGRWRWTTRLDVTQSNPTYTIRDVVSPYGLLRDSIPIDGEVVLAMSNSIVELKANFAPHILIGPTSSFSFTVDEGRGFAPAQEVQITNDGVYGSLLGVTLTPSASYVRVTPAQVGNLALNESGIAQLLIDATNLLASNSPYAAAVTVQDPSALNSPLAVPVAITVRPKATISLPTTTLTFTVAKPLTGSFPTVANQTFAVVNSGPSGSVLNYDTQKLIGVSDWLISFLPADGTLAASQSQTVTVHVVPPDWMLPGTYTETLRTSGYSTNSYADVQIQLVIS